MAIITPTTQTQLPQDSNRASGILASMWVPVPFATVIVCARLFVRWRRVSLGVDDWTMIATWIFYMVNIILGTLPVARVGVRHIQFLSMGDIEYILKLAYFTAVTGTTTVLLGKLSVGLFLIRLMGPIFPWGRYFLYGNLLVYTLVSLATIGILLGQCVPVTGNWDIELISKGATHCVEKGIMYTVQEVQNALGTYIDFVLALLPITIFWEMNLSTYKKIGLSCLLGLGMFAGLCSLIKTAQYRVIEHSKNPSWDCYAFVVWAVLETHCIVIGGSLPAAKPLWDCFYYKLPITAQRL